MVNRRAFVVTVLALTLTLGACSQADSTTTLAPVTSTTQAQADSTTTSTIQSTPVGGGGRIAYEVRSGGAVLGLSTVDPEGAEVGEVGEVGILATWSPDGSRIAYLRSGNSRKNDLYVIDADGENKRRLTDTSEEEGIPAWSPNADTIAVAIPKDGDSEIYLLDAETGAIVSQLTDNEGIDDYMPAWSPGGTQIVYVAKGVAEGSDEIHIMDADGSNSLQLTDNAVDDYYPAWSPNGDTIAFVSLRDGEQSLFTMNVDGSNQRRLSDGEDRDSRPAWSPDGTTIAYHVRGDNDWAIELIELASREVTLLVESGVHPAWSRPSD